MTSIPIKPSLPQNDNQNQRDARRKALAINQEKYNLSKTNHLGLPLLKTPLPCEEFFDKKYTVERYVAKMPRLSNDERVKPILIDCLGSSSDLNDYESMSVDITDPSGPFSGLNDYESMFIDIPKPDVANHWLADEIFAEQRLSGVNPVMIELVRDKKNFPTKLDTKQLRRVLNGYADLNQLISNKQLYIVDFTSYLDGIPEGKLPPPNDVIQKYLPKPIGLFYWNEADPKTKAGRLLPLAIQVDLDNNEAKIFTPNSQELLWTIAKICFSIADANVHEMSTHLGRAHFAQEPFGAITPCQLAEQHPISILLKPHLRFLVCNNQKGMEELVQQHGPVDRLLAATLEGSISLAVKAAKRWSVTETFFESIEARQMSSKVSLPHYPYRDDGILIWDAVTKYVSEYTNIYYQSNKDIQGDYELQAWAKKLADTGVDGGNIKDMPSQIDDVEQLSQILSIIIFSNSAGHSSVNYSQYPYMGFSPNMPLAGYSNYRKFLTQDKTTQEEQLTFIRNFLPPKILALGQIDITYELSSYHYDSLGNYAKELTDPLAKHALYRFTQSLSAIERKIEMRNRQRVVPYKFLLPSEILNSASI